MFERFTGSLRKVMSLARQEAQNINSDFICTEHLLLGLLREGGAVAEVLREHKVDLDGVGCELKRIPQPAAYGILGQIPFSPRAKAVIMLAGEASEKHGHNVIGTEHLLLGLLGEREGVAFQILSNLGVHAIAMEFPSSYLIKNQEI